MRHPNPSVGARDRPYSPYPGMTSPGAWACPHPKGQPFEGPRTDTRHYPYTPVHLLVHWS